MGGLELEEVGICLWGFKVRCCLKRALRLPITASPPSPLDLNMAQQLRQVNLAYVI